MTDRNLLPGEYAVLGVLLEGPMHGYEMARLFEAEDLAQVCPVEQSSLYTYLRNVEARGLVTWEETRVGNRPPRKIYALTEAGRDALLAWLHEPVTRLREVRLDFLLKLYFLHALDREAEGQLLREQIAECEVYLARIDAATPASAFQRLVLGSKRSAAEATLGWLKAYAFEFEHPLKGNSA